MPLATAAPASADSFNMFADRLMYGSSAINFCVSAHNAESHTYWYTTTYADEYNTGCGYHGEPADGARIDIWWYKNGDGHGGFAYRTHWGFFHNTMYDDHVFVDHSGPMSCVDGTCGPGYWSMDALHTAADWWGNFQGGWAVNVIHHLY